METVLVNIDVVQEQIDLTSTFVLPQNQSEPLLMHNLLNDLAELTHLLRTEVRRSSWLNAYLLAAGMNQIMEDYLHPDPYFLSKASRYLSRMPSPLGAVAAQTTRLLSPVMQHLYNYRSQTRQLWRWQANLATFIQGLADVVVWPGLATTGLGANLLELSEMLLAPVEGFPTQVRREVLRLPSCFRSFDQQPADLERIVGNFAQKWPDRYRPLVVMGIRTSGSYLAPLYAAFLKRQGYRDISVLTLRPGRRLLKTEQTLLQSTIRRVGLVLVTDDPPTTGSSLAQAIADLERVGVPPHSIILLLQLFGASDTLPAALQKYQAVLLPWTEWAVHEKLSSGAVRSNLSELFGSAITVSHVQHMPVPARKWVRSHAHALFRADLLDHHSGRQWEQYISVKGAGLGYFGEHALAVAQHLRKFTPEIYGFREGLLYRAWLPPEDQLCAIEPGQKEMVVGAVAAYILARHQALTVDEDVSLRLIGQNPVWEVASNLLSRAFGRGWWLARVPVVDPLVRRLLKVEHPSVIDGNTSLSHWFLNGEQEDRLLKVDFDERAFCNLDLYCYDPVFDLAGLAASCGDNELAEHLRRAYEHLQPEAIGAERWLLYQMVHLWDLQRNQGSEPDQSQWAFSRTLQSYFAELYFKELSVPGSGALCAFDLDGVLETESLGFPGLTPASALTLRALNLHGFRPILATGRSLDEVRERCAAYRLAGGVAEYGAVVYDHRRGAVRELLSPTEYADLIRLRAALGEIQGIYLDPDYRYAVRAFSLDANGLRKGLKRDLVTTTLIDLGLEQRIRPIFGQAQTDFMVAAIDKGAGLRCLVEELGMDTGTEHKKPLALAVGDTMSDLPMFELAHVACAPAHAGPDVRRTGVRMMKQPYQAGVALAATYLLGHQPGDCPCCRLSVRLSPETRSLLTLLATQERGKWGLLWHALILGIRTGGIPWATPH